MGDAKLAYTEEVTKSFKAVEFLLKSYTYEKRPNIVSLMTTGNTIDQLEKIRPFTIEPNYEVHGLLVKRNDWKNRILDFLLGTKKNVNFSLQYDWGTINISWDSQIKDIDESIRFMRFPNHDLLNTDKGCYIKKYLPKILNELEINFNLDGTTELQEGANIKIDISGYFENFSFYFNKNQNKLTKHICKSFIDYLDTPEKIHIILSSNLDDIKNLLNSGEIILCRDCCSYNLGYLNVDGNRSNIDLNNIEKLVQFLISEPCRDRSISFRGFTWIWEKEINRSYANGLIWSLNKKNTANIHMWWDLQLPRGTLPKIKKSANDFIAWGGPREGQGSHLKY